MIMCKLLKKLNEGNIFQYTGVLWMTWKTLLFIKFILSSMMHLIYNPYSAHPNIAAQLIVEGV